MDIAEFVERFFDIKLRDWQKDHLRTLDKMRKDADIRIVMSRHAGESQMHIYMNNHKELFANGSSNANK